MAHKRYPAEGEGGREGGGGGGGAGGLRLGSGSVARVRRLAGCGGRVGGGPKQEERGARGGGGGRRKEGGVLWRGPGWIVLDVCGRAGV